MWLERRDRDIRWNTFVSTKERRLAFFRGGNVTLKDPGEYRVPLLEQIEAVGLVNMTPMAITVELPGVLHSRESISMSAKVTAILRVRDEADSISRVALHAEIEERLAIGRITAGFQNACSTREWKSLKNCLPSIADEVKKYVEFKSGDGSLAFDVLDVTVNEIRIHDPELDQNAVELVLAAERVIREEGEAVGKLTKVRANIEIEKLQEEAERGKRKKKVEDEIEEEQARTQVLLNAAKGKAELLGTSAGLWALNPEAAVQLEITKLKLDASKQEDMKKILLQMVQIAQRSGVEAGRSEALLEFARKQLGLTFTTIDTSLGGRVLSAGSKGEETAADVSSTAGEDKAT